jgi:hypothetical protein
VEKPHAKSLVIANSSSRHGEILFTMSARAICPTISAELFVITRLTTCGFSTIELRRDGIRLNDEDDAEEAAMVSAGHSRRHTDWVHSRPVIELDIVTATAVSMLVSSAEESPVKPL